MSDTFLQFIPADATRRPSKGTGDKALALVQGFGLGADQLTAEFSDTPLFYSPGEALETVACPLCHADAEPWWADAMGAADETDFTDLAITTPCCNAKTSLNALDYQAPAGFARFAIEATNPTRDTTPEEDAALAACLAMPMRKIWLRL